jgi:hypothetical protein
MNVAPDAYRMEAAIRREYEARLRRYPEAALGWRLLYSPQRVLCGARVAFIGFNPGGHTIDPSHGEFSTEAGSAYRKEVENWGANSSLQDQVIALFNRLDVAPEDVLSGNLVPFRSPSERSLRGTSEAISFGKNLWKEIFAKVRPSIVISMGESANSEISRLLMVRNTKIYSVEWGKKVAYRGSFNGGNWIGLPHLSRFAIMKRSASQAALNELFKDLY